MAKKPARAPKKSKSTFARRRKMVLFRRSLIELITLKIDSERVEKDLERVKEIIQSYKKESQSIK